MGNVKSRVSRIAVTVSVAAALGLTAACGGGGGVGGKGAKPSKAKGSETAPADPKASPADSGALTRAELEKAALASGDVKDYQVKKMPASDIGLDSVPADPAACQPIADMFLFTSDPAARAATGRSFAAKDDLDASVTSLALLAYGSGEAEKVLDGLRTSTGKCTKYEHTGYQYSGVKVLKDPDLGDESVAYRLLGSIEGASVPTTFTVVRVGTTVVTFTAMNMLDGDKVKVPSAIVDAQLKKLKKLKKATA